MNRSNWQLALVCGSRRVDLITDPTTGGWTLMEKGASFTTSDVSVNYSGTTPWRAGSERTSSFRNNVQFTLSLNLKNQVGLGLLQRNIHDVYKFVVDTWYYHEQKGRDPVYLVMRLDEGFSGTGEQVVLFGRGDMYHEILSVDNLVFPNEAFSVSLMNTGNATIANVQLKITCKPYVMGKPVFLGEATGWVRTNSYGDISVWGAATNLYKNPSYENTSASTEFVAQSASILATTNYEHVRTGFQSLQISNISDSSPLYVAASTTLAASIYWHQVYAYTGGSAVTSDDLVLYDQAGSLLPSYAADSEHAGWYRLTASFAATAASALSGVQVKQGKAVVCDDFQLETNTLSPFILDANKVGPGVAWAGTEHYSTTTRTAGQYRVRRLLLGHPGYETLNYRKGTFSCWVNTSWAGNDGVEHDLIDCYVSGTQNRIRVMKYSDNKLYLDMWGSTASGNKYIDTAVLTTTTWPANTDLFIVAQWDETGPLGIYVYRAAGSVSDTTVHTVGTWTALNSCGSYWYLGSMGAGTLQWNGWIGDVRIFGPDATVTPANLYAAGKGRSELGFIWTSTIGGAVQATSDGTNKNYFYVSNLGGDIETPLRLVLYNDGGSWDMFWLGLHKGVQFPYYLNVQETANSYYGTAGSEITASNQSGSSYTAIIAGSGNHIPGTWIVLSDPRLGPYIHAGGRYRAILTTFDTTATPGYVYYKCSIAHNTASGGAAVAAQHNATPWTDPVYNYKSGSWASIDLGVFDIILADVPRPFYGQNRQAISTGSNYISLELSTTYTSGSDTPTFGYDYLVLMPEKGVISGTLGTDDVLIIDGISNGICYYANESASDISLEVSGQSSFVGPVPVIPPNTWIFGNVILDRSGAGSYGADTIKVFAIYQPRYLWGR